MERIIRDREASVRKVSDLIGENVGYETVESFIRGTAALLVYVCHGKDSGLIDDTFHVSSHWILLLSPNSYMDGTIGISAAHCRMALRQIYHINEAWFVVKYNEACWFTYYTPGRIYEEYTMP